MCHDCSLPAHVFADAYALLCIVLHELLIKDISHLVSSIPFCSFVFFLFFLLLVFLASNGPSFRVLQTSSISHQLFARPSLETPLFAILAPFFISVSLTRSHVRFPVLMHIPTALCYGYTTFLSNRRRAFCIQAYQLRYLHGASSFSPFHKAWLLTRKLVNIFSRGG